MIDCEPNVTHLLGVSVDQFLTAALGAIESIPDMADTPALFRHRLARCPPKTTLCHRMIDSKHSSSKASDAWRLQAKKQRGEADRDSDQARKIHPEIRKSLSGPSCQI
jgi:hypothetical protein